MNLTFNDYLTLLQLVDKHIVFLERDKTRNANSIPLFEELKAKIVAQLPKTLPNKSSEA